MSAIDWAAVVVYLAIITGIGIYFGRYMREVADFFKGGNEIPWWLSGISSYMTGFSAFVFVAYAKMAYDYGLMAATLCWTVVPAYLVGAYVFAPLWRRTGILTPVEYLEQRYNIAVRQLFGWVGIPVRLIDDSLKIVAMGTFISVIMKVDMIWAMVVLGAVVVLYCVIGGLWAVVITDMVQFVVLSVSLALVVPLALIRVGGVGKLVEGSPEGFFRLMNPNHPEIGWPYFIAFAFLIFLSYNSTWSLVQRSYAVKDERAARKASLLAAFLSFITPIFWILPSLCARQILPNLADGGQSFVRVCVAILPAGFLGIVLAGMFSATMSTLSSDYNIFAGVITEDIYRRLFNTGLFKWMADNFGIALPPMAVPMLGGLLWRRTTAVGCIVTYFVGLGTALFFKFGCDLPFWYFTGANIAVSAAAFVLCGLLLPRCGVGEAARVNDLFARLKTPLGRDELAAIERRAAQGPSPLHIVGVILCAIGGLLALLGVAPMAWNARITNWVLAAVLIVLGVLGMCYQARPPQEAGQGQE
jgi:SSS family solute:Na+ symporter